MDLLSLPLHEEFQYEQNREHSNATPSKCAFVCCTMFPFERVITNGVVAERHECWETTQVIKVEHYQHHKWPDHGIPNMRLMSELVYEMGIKAEEKAVPLVHCR